MGFFRQSPEVRAAQADLNAYSEKQWRNGNYEETDEFRRLNGRVNDAIRDEKQQQRDRKSR
jgi:hypothetical protein